MGNRNTSLKEDGQKHKIDSSTRHSFRKNRKKLKKSITAPLTANGSPRQLLPNSGNHSDVGRSLPATPNLSKHSPAPSSHSCISPSAGNKLEVKIFRSYTRLNDAGKKRGFLEETPTNIRIYKRSANNSEVDLASNRMASRSYSLPRELCRNKNLRNSGVSSSTENFDNLSIKKTRRSVLTSRSSTVSRLNSFSDPSSSTYRVKKSDFTNVDTLKKKLHHFSKSLSTFLTASFLSLPPSQLTSLLPISFHPSPSSSFKQPPLTLQQFLDASDDITTIIETNHPLLYVSKELFELIKTVKNFHKSSAISSQDPPQHTTTSPPDVASICRRMVEQTVEEVVWEACRVLEYQVCLLSGNMTIESTARCLSERITSYVLHQMKHPLIDHNSLLEGLLKGRVNKPQQPPPVASVIIGMKELKWNLYDLVDKAGLRKDTLLAKESLEGDLEAFTFHTAAFSDPMLYGYRGVMLEWDRSRGTYRQHPKEKEAYEEEVTYRYDDFHRIYLPHFRAVGSQAFNRLTSGDHSKDMSRLMEGFRDAFRSSSYFLNDIHVTFYPTKVLPFDWNTACHFNPFLKAPQARFEDSDDRITDNASKNQTQHLNNDLQINKDDTTTTIFDKSTFSSSFNHSNLSPSSAITTAATYPNTSTPTSTQQLDNGYHSDNQHTQVHRLQLQPPQKILSSLQPSKKIPPHPAQKPPLSPKQSQLPSPRLSYSTQQPQQPSLPPKQRPHPPQKPPPPPRGRSTLSSDECEGVLRCTRALIHRDNAPAVVRSSDLFPVFNVESHTRDSNLVNPYH